jgi:hypothetical protein
MDRNNLGPWRLHLMDNRGKAKREERPQDSSCRTEMRYLLQGCGDEGRGGGKERSGETGPMWRHRTRALGVIYTAPEMIPPPDDGSSSGRTVVRHR